MNKNPIYVTKPTLPTLKEFIPYLEKIWESRVVTNNGPYHQQFEKELADFLGVKYISLFTNGTLALISALQVLRITGEVITTPYTFVATTHALHWNNIKPVFVDVDPVYGNLDPLKIEAAITLKTTAIVPVHVYGNPVEMEKIQEIADTYGLKVIYDAAHAFGVDYKNQSILNWGDLSILSFHATKVFNTIEGGAIICHDEKTKKRIDFLKNFGFTGETTVIAPGINAKMNEIQAVLGLLQLKLLKENIKNRQLIASQYNSELHHIKGIRLLKKHQHANRNYSYYPIFIDEKEYGKTRDELYDELKTNNIFGRRYFYPLVTEFSMYKGLDSARPKNLIQAHKIARQVICLPIYSELQKDDIKRITHIINSNKK